MQRRSVQYSMMLIVGRVGEGGGSFLFGFHCALHVACCRHVGHCRHASRTENLVIPSRGDTN